MNKLVICLLISMALGACGGGSSGAVARMAPPPTATMPATPTTSSTTSCPEDIDAGGSLQITDLPNSAASEYQNNFCKYTDLVAPNGGVIAFYAQNQIGNEQLVRARSILQFFLTDVPGSQYGADKTSVFNQMANNSATLILLNGSDDGNPPANGQTLYETENVVEGSSAYVNNDPRDAAFEEILHLMHDTGIGVDGANTQPGVLAAYQTEIRAATENAIPPGVITSNAAQLGLWASTALDWLQELAPESSLTQEYLASVIDTYYGLAGESTANGSNELYQPQTRAQIQSLDLMGWALVGGDSPRKFFSEFVTYEARIDSSFRGTFTLAFDRTVRCTHKSQYLMDARLTGTEPSNLQGNAQTNRLTGNASDNQLTGGPGDDRLDGGDGSDTAIFTGPSTEYTVSTAGEETTVVDTVANRDGTDVLLNVELLQFNDTSFSP